MSSCRNVSYRIVIDKSIKNGDDTLNLVKTLVGYHTRQACMKYIDALRQSGISISKIAKLTKQTPENIYDQIKKTPHTLRLVDSENTPAIRDRLRDAGVSSLSSGQTPTAGGTVAGQTSVGVGQELKTMDGDKNNPLRN